MPHFAEPAAASARVVQQLTWRTSRQEAEQDLIDEGKDGGVSADAEGEAGNGDGAEDQGFPQGPERETKVSQKLFYLESCPERGCIPDYMYQ